MSLLIAKPPNQTNGIEKKTPKYYLNKKRRLLEPLEEVDGYFREAGREARGCGCRYTIYNRDLPK
jgi:hypothetical protein